MAAMRLCCRSGCCVAAVLLLLLVGDLHAAQLPTSKDRASLRGSGSIVASTLSSSEGSSSVPSARETALVEKASKASLLLSGGLAESQEVEAIEKMLEEDSQTRKAKLPSEVRVWCPPLDLHVDCASEDVASGAGPTHASPRALADTFNSKYSMKPMTWATAMSDELAAITVGGVWWSGKVARTKTEPVPVTLISQASIDRVPQLYNQCQSWKGPLSVVLYLGLQQDQVADGELTQENKDLIKRAALKIHNLFVDVEKNRGICQLDVMLAYEVYTERKAMMLYPINVLRNLARLQARTPMVALVDVDMLISANFYQDLMKKPEMRQEMMEATSQRKTAYVLPAFEAYGTTYEAAAAADLLASRDKRFLIESVLSGVSGPFDFHRFPLGHNWTLFDKWYQASKPYVIEYGHRYEPWTIVDRVSAPWHDTRFRGYGQNKIVHVASMNASNYTFSVLPNVFIIHRAHAHTTVRLRLVASKQVYDAAKLLHQPIDTASIYGHTKTLFDEAQVQMGEGKFRATLDEATRHALKTLSWWKGSTPA